MPQPKTTEFCPQCGCTGRLSVSPLEDRIRFTCGETLFDLEDTLTASYTCKTIPARMQDMEQAMSLAMLAVDKAASVGYTTSRALQAALEDAQHMVSLSSSVAFRLVNIGVLAPVGRTRIIGHALTPLGIVFAKYLKEEECKWTTL